VIGVVWGAQAARDPVIGQPQPRRIIDLVEAGRLKPVVARTFPITQIADAMQALLSRRYAGKIVLQVD